MTQPSLARWWHEAENQAVICDLCPRHCFIPDGGRGYCSVRENHDGILYALAYGHPVSVAIDPIEKKPLARFMPRTRTLSFGTFGCNLGCVFCQNASLSRGHYPSEPGTFIPPEQFIDLAKALDPVVTY